MDAKLFFKKTETLYSQTVENLKTISFEKETLIEVSETSLMELDQAIRRLKSLVSSFPFETLADEIYFFKEVKPLFISRFIFHAKVLEIESFKPEAGEKFLKKYYRSFLCEFKRFYNENKNFYNYCNKKATFLDYKYFVRNKHDIKNGLPLELYDFDENFTTSHDGILSKIIAYKELEKFLSHRITKSSFERESIPEKVSLLSWSASKSALIELLYALHQTKCFNSGNIEFSEIVHTAERVLNIKLGNFYKTIGEIKARKNGRTKFLQLLNDNLNQLFLESDQ